MPKFYHLFFNGSFTSYLHFFYIYNFFKSIFKYLYAIYEDSMCLFLQRQLGSEYLYLFRLLLMLIQIISCTVFMYKILYFVFIVVVVFSKSFPIFNYSYQVPFDQTIIYNKISYRTVGQWFYDPLKSRERVDRLSGQYNEFCGTILPNVTTPCTSLTVDGNRWQIFPARSQCCLCCTVLNNCGILRPDWLNGAEDQGEFTIDGVNYDKWCKQGAATQDCLYVTIGQELPRRLDESGVQILDYNLKQFKKINFSDSVFAVPSYCNSTKPTFCPKTSLCGNLQKKASSLKEADENQQK